MQPLQNCIGHNIRIGREILCLPYAGFFRALMGPEITWSALVIGSTNFKRFWPFLFFFFFFFFFFWQFTTIFDHFNGFRLCFTVFDHLLLFLTFLKCCQMFSMCFWPVSTVLKVFHHFQLLVLFLCVTIFNYFLPVSYISNLFQPFQLFSSVLFVFNCFSRFSTVLHRCYYPQPPRNSLSPICRINKKIYLLMLAFI